MISEEKSPNTLLICDGLQRSVDSIPQTTRVSSVASSEHILSNRVDQLFIRAKRTGLNRRPEIERSENQRVS